MGARRRATHVLLAIVTLIIGAAAAAVIVSQTAWFKNWLRGYLVRQANQYLNGTLSVQRLGGSLFFGVEMEGVAVSMDGKPVVAVKDLGLDYNAIELVARGLSIDAIRLDHPVIYLRRTGGSWDLSRLVKRQRTEADRAGPGRPIAVDDIGISNGSVVLESAVGTSGVKVPGRVDRIDARLSFKYEPVRYSIEISHVSFRASDPAIAVNALSGGVSVRNDTVNIDRLALRTAETSLSVDGAVQQYASAPRLNLRISSDKLSVPEIGRLVPSLAAVRLQPAFDVELSGPLDRLAVDVNVRSSAGRLDGRLTTDLAAPGQSVRGDLTIRHLNLKPMLPRVAQPTDITATTRLDVRAASFSNLDSLAGRLDVDAPRVEASGVTVNGLRANATIAGRRVDLDARADAYGASATVRGRVRLPGGRQAATFDVGGRIRQVDLVHLPRQLGLPSAETDVNLAYHVAGARPAFDADVTLDASTIAGARLAPGGTAHVSTHGSDIAYQADTEISHLDLQRVGRELKIAALAADRFATDINVHLRANGQGTSPRTMIASTQATLTDSSLFGAKLPRMAIDASIRHGALQVGANGTFSGLDPAAVSGNSKIAGEVNGSVDLRATLPEVTAPVAPAAVQAGGTVTLKPSRIAGLSLNEATLTGRYAERAASIDRLDITGPDLTAHAAGTLALNDSGASDLTLQVAASRLDQIGRIANVPLTGIAKLEATITGNRQALQATGRFTGDGVRYAGNGALTIGTDFTARVPDLQPADGDVSATTHATFVSLGGQHINELDAKTDYRGQQLAFDATARQPERTLTAAGNAGLDPADQNVRLHRLALQSRGMSWQLRPGAHPVVRWGHGAVAVSDLQLVDGGQQIAVDGTVGQPGRALKVILNHVQLATIDALLLRPPQLTGTLDATGTIAGTLTSPDVEAEAHVADGGFRRFKYDALDAMLGYRDQTVDLDARLQENPSAWIEAKGTVPTALITGAAAGATAPVDLRVDSSPIDLGLVQGFTTALTGVGGTVQAHVALAGTAGNPQPSGTIALENGKFTVQPTGVGYSQLNGRVELQADRVHIPELRLVDNHNRPLTLSGDLAFEERRVGAMSVTVKADDFKVLDDKMGNVRINSNLTVTGDLTAPRVDGDLGISTGQINLDPILATIGTSAYATKPTEYASAATGEGQTAPPSRFNPVQLEVHVTVPDDFVVKADDLKAPGSPIGLGALNVTLGGDLWISKTPWDRVRLVGPVRTIRGTYDFQGRRFTILRDGTVRFEGGDEIDPALDVKTERLIQAVTAYVTVGGRLKMPEITLSSVPPLEQADILALVVFNQPLSNLGEGQQISLAQRAESLATGAVAGELAKSIGNALNLDTFEINVAPVTGGGPEVTLGEQLGQNLYVRVEQGIGAESVTNFVLEYEIARWLRLRTNVLEGSTPQQQVFQRTQDSGVDMLFVFSY